MKVYELAKEMSLSNDQLISKLQELGSDIKHHMATIDDKLIEKVKGKDGEVQDNDSQGNDKNEEVEQLKKQLAEVQKLLAEKEKADEKIVNTEEKNQEKIDSMFAIDEWDDEYIPEIPMNKTIKIMSLFSGGLNLKTSEDGNGAVFRFEYVGQVYPIIYSDLIKIIANQRKFFEQGYCMVLDKNVIKAHYLEEHYKKFVDGKVINNILSYEPERIKEIFSGTTPVIQQSIVDVIVKKILNNEYFDKNKVTVINEIYGTDIFELANKMK